MKFLYVAALAAVIPCAGSAKGLKPGLYNVANLQQICLVAGGTWTSPTFSNWGGNWAKVGKNTHVYGNYNSGAGNDSIVIKGATASWTEWSDDLTFNNVLDPTTFTYVSACSEAAKIGPNAQKNPMQR